MGDSGSAAAAPRSTHPDPLRLVFLCNALRFGGSQSVIRELVLAAIGIGCEAIVGSRGGELEATMREAGARTSTLLLREGAARGADSRLVSALKSGASLVGVAQLAASVRLGRTVFHASQPWPVAIASAAAIATGVPLIWHAHGTTAVEMPPAWIPAVRRASRAWVAITPEVEAAMRDLEPPRHTRVLTIPSPIAVDVPACEMAVPQPGVLGAMSTLTESKRAYVQACIEAASELASVRSFVHLKVVGEGPDRQFLERLAEATEARTPNLKISIGSATHDPWRGLANCELIVGMGLVALEAAIRGHNVVCASSYGLGAQLTSESYPRLFQTNFTGRGMSPLIAEALTDLMQEAATAGRDPELGPMVARIHGQEARDRWTELWKTIQ